MTESNSSTLQKPDPDEPSTELDTMLQAARPGPQEPPETRGRTTFTDGAVEKIAGIAAREVPGINALGGGFTRTMGAVRDRVPGGHASAGHGVKADVGEKQTAIDLQVVQRDRGLEGFTACEGVRGTSAFRFAREPDRVRVRWARRSL